MNKIKFFLCSVVFLTATLSIQAQNATFEWSDLISNTKVGLQNPTLVFPNASGFTTYTVEKQGTQVFAPESVFITKFNANGDAGKTLDFSLPKRALKDATLLKIIEGEDKLYVFSFIAVKKDKKNVLYAQVYNNTSGEVSETKEVYTLPIEKVNTSGFFGVQISEDRNTIAVLVNKPFIKKTKESIEVVILDADLNTISNSEHILSFDSERAYREELFVGNDATVTIVKKTDIFKKEPITSAITITGDAISEQQVSANEFYISDNRVVTIKGKQYLLGFATDNAKPTVSMGGAKDKSFFIYNITDQKLIKNQEWNPEITKRILGKGFIDLKVKDIVVQNDEIYLIGDRFSEESKPIPGQNFEYNYTYNFGPGVVVKLNTNGDVAYDSYIKYDEEYKNHMQPLGSFKPFIRDNIIYFFANEKVSILEEKKIVFGWKNINAKAIVTKKLESDGSLSIEAFKSGIVGGKENVVDFAPTKTIQLDDNTYYIYALGNKYQAFGKMTIE
ncbi:hypothetical protein [Olleya sp. YS]|uniref:hypothetical protein n=1 Tax=Olleya sp. YS TaxID=3028318 RepID=UPI0024345E63|nr:hypothetical protein [Olleya sp. YS]WGD35242.1 hypothetical protein Ollyesu_02235 [Olleya sp. YS]